MSDLVGNPKDRFVSYQIENPKYSFSGEKAHKIN